MARLLIALIGLVALVATASSLEVGGTQKPLRPKPTRRSTSKPMTIFKDGKMDEEPLQEDEPEPVTVALPARNQKAPATAAPEPVVDDANVAIYKLLGSSGTACILFKVDAVLDLKFKTKLNEDSERDMYVPNAAGVTGECGSGDDARLVLSWQDFTLSMYFTKTPGGDRWYVEKVDLLVNTDNNRIFEHIKNPGRRIHLSTGPGNAQLFPTPTGKSYQCEKEIAVDLGQGDVRAVLRLRGMQVQPFIFRKGEFGPAYVCTPAGVSFRDETAPIAVGSTLAIVVLCTVTGYGVFRYFKIKKVQYDTME